jgi:hypothetical protein
MMTAEDTAASDQPLSPVGLQIKSECVSECESSAVVPQQQLRRELTFIDGICFIIR